MIRVIKSTIVCWTIGCLMACGGCIVPGAEVYRKAPLPEGCERIVGVHRTEMTLESGRNVVLAGVSLDGMTEEQVDAFQAKCAEILVNNCHIVVAEGGKLARIDQLWYNMPKSNVIPVFPRVVYVEASRADLGERLIAAGLCRAKPGELSEPELRERYVAAEQKAKERGDGIWGQSR